MALDRQIVDVVFRGGVDTKTDPKQVVPGKFLALENCTFESPGRTKKRNGLLSLGTPCSSARLLATRGDELVAGDDSALYSYDSAGQTWRNRGAFAPVSTSVLQIVRTEHVQYNPSIAEIGGYRLFAYEDTDAAGALTGVHYTVVDAVTGQHVVSNALVDAAGLRPMVVVIGSNFAVFYATATAIECRLISAADPTVVGSVVAISNPASSTRFDVARIGIYLYVACARTATTVDIVAYDNSLTAWYSASIARTGACTAISISRANLSTNDVALAWADGTNMRYAVYSADLASQIALATFDTGVTCMSMVAAPAVNSLHIHYSPSTSVTTKRAVIGPSPYPVTSGAAVRWQGIFLASRAFTWNGASYLAVHYFNGNAGQSTFFVVEASSGRVVAKALPGTASGEDFDGQESAHSAPFVLGNKVLWSCGQYISLAAIDGSLMVRPGVSLVSMTFAGSPQWQEAARSIHVAGGRLTQYDGASAVEHGFNLFPNEVTATGGGAGTTYSHQYCACYEWTDAGGAVHRSAPSPVKTLEHGTAISGANAIALTATALPLTDKAAVSVVWFRTVDKGTVFYRLNSPRTPVANVTTATTVSYSDTTTDANLIGNQQLYTTGGVLENIQAPSSSAIAIYKNRVVLVNAENPTELWYSKQTAPGSAVEFSDALTLSVDPQGGDIVAVAALDDKLVLFKRERIFWMTGTGPDATGGQNDFSEPAPLPSDVGCVNAASVARCPQGLVFQSAKGLYLLDRSLNVSYVGADVESYVGQSSDFESTGTAITSALAVPVAHQARWALGSSSGKILVHDYRAEQWGVFAGIDAACSAAWKGAVVHLTPVGQVLREQAGRFSDETRYVPQKWQTGWLKMAGLQGFQCAHKMFILGEYVSPHVLTVEIAYDYDPTVVQTNTITSATDPGAPYQFRVDLARHRCESVQVTITESQYSASVGEGIRLTGVTFEVSLARGPYRLPATRQLG